MTEKATHTLHYRAYLIRFWQETEDGPWRGLLENPHTGEHHGFASLDQMLAFLHEQARQTGPPEKVGDTDTLTTLKSLQQPKRE